jgi:hypothetical protein
MEEAEEADEEKDANKVASPVFLRLCDFVLR